MRHRGPTETGTACQLTTISSRSVVRQFNGNRFRLSLYQERKKIPIECVFHFSDSIISQGGVRHYWKHNIISCRILVYIYFFNSFPGIRTLQQSICRSMKGCFLSLFLWVAVWSLGSDDLDGLWISNTRHKTSVHIDTCSSKRCLPPVITTPLGSFTYLFLT